MIDSGGQFSPEICGVRISSELNGCLGEILGSNILDAIKTPNSW